nr:MAG TPA: hypothetical protein [Caudoviricetes sp.]
MHSQARIVDTLIDEYDTHIKLFYKFALFLTSAELIFTQTTIYSLNSSFRNIMKKGSFRNEDAVYKLLCLPAQELYENGQISKHQTWACLQPTVDR